MAVKIGFFLVALLSTARSNPLGQTSIETASILPNLLPNVGSNTVCETTPNVLGLGLGYGPLGLNVPSPLALQLLSSYGLPLPNLGATTVCDTKPNIGNLPLLPPYGLPLPNIGTTTVCDTKPNLGALIQPYGLPLPGSTTVCDSTPNVISPYGLPVQGLGSTTVCESAQNIPPYILPPYGLPLQRLARPYGISLNGLTVGSLGLPIL